MTHQQGRLEDTMAEMYVYRLAISDEGNRSAACYRIVKRTRKCLYVDRQVGADGDPPEIRRCFVIDRVPFERDGKVWCPSRSHFYYATEAQALG
jgi:hypothetical protein